MKSCITSIGIATPEHRVAQDKIFKFMSTAHQLNEVESGRLKKLYDLSGIEFRHSVISDFGKAKGEYSFFANSDNLEPFPNTKERLELYKNTALKISMEAVHNCLNQLKDFNLNQITHLITVSCTGMYAPGLDIELVESLNLNSSVERTCINFMGCYGAFNGLKFADYICRADANAKVLIVDIELCTIHFQKLNHMDNWIANSLFSDGAAAVLVESEHTKNKGFKLEAFHSELISEAKNDMAWSIGNTGFEMKLSSQIAKKIKKTILGISETLLKKANLSIQEIKHFAIHPGGRRILEVCEEEFEKDMSMNKHSYDVLKNYGNMSSATILFVLHKYWLDRGKEIQKGPLLSFAFGPGLTFESMILEIH